MKNGTDSNRSNNATTKRTKLATAVGTKRRRSSVDSAIDPAILRSASDVESVTATEPTDIDSAGSDAGNVEQFSGGSGNNDRGTGNGTGSSDSGSGSESTKRKRGRPAGTGTGTKLDTQNVVQRVRRPRKVLDDLEDGVEASILIISAAIQTASELAAVTANKRYFVVQKSEADELAVATKKCLDQLPKAARKRFDQIMGKYYPFYNLAVVLTKVVYPRVKIYQMEQQSNNEGQNQSNERTDYAEPSEFGQEFVGNPLN